MTLERLLLLLLSLAFTVVTFSLLTIIKRFIESKPPGRRLVTSDVHILKVRGCSETTLPITPTQAAVLKMLILSVTVPLALRACLGPLPFSVAFAATESLKVHITSHQHIVGGYSIQWTLTEHSKVSYTIYGGIVNFSAALQLAMIANIRFVFHLRSCMYFLSIICCFAVPVLV